MGFGKLRFVAVNRVEETTSAELVAAKDTEAVRCCQALPWQGCLIDALVLFLPISCSMVLSKSPTGVWLVVSETAQNRVDKHVSM